MHKHLYTVIVEFAGGTYIDQVRVQLPGEAPGAWLRQQDISDLKRWKVDQEAFRIALGSHALSPLNGLVNASCLTFASPSGLAIFTVIGTEDPET